MNTFLLKIGCTFLFGFIFFLSFQTEPANQQQFSSHQQQELLKQEAVVISANATSDSEADYETRISDQNLSLQQVTQN